MNLNNMIVIIVTEEQYKKEGKLLLGRFSTAISIIRMQKLHTFLPVGKGVVLAKIFFTSTDSVECSVTLD
jgi:hypothetical protein